MQHYKRHAVVFVGSLLAAAAAAQQQTPNDEVLQLVQAGLSDEVVIAKIRQIPIEKRDTSADALIALREAGASEAVLAELVKTVSDAAPKPQSPDFGQEVDHPFQITMLTTEGEQQIWAARASTQVSMTRAMTFRSSTSVALSGTTASTRTTDPRPRFILPEAWVTADVALIELDVKGKKRQRIARFGSGFGGTKGLGSAKQKLVIPTTIRRDGQRTIVEPTADLEPGEYAISIFMKIFDFSVRR